MTYTSYWFFIFLIIVILFYYLLPQRRRYIVLLLASLAFIYFAGGAVSLIFISASALAAYLSGLFSEKGGNKTLPAFVIILLIGVMALFRSGFMNSINLTVVPIGLSFYSLSLISYVADVSSGKTEAEKDPLRFLLYTAYFPHILQGPIARYDKLSKTLYSGGAFDYERVTRGFQLIIWGLFKKLVVADRLGIFVDGVYGDYSQCGAVEIVMAIIMYGFQLYADFSGCVEISIGVSEIFGVSLQQNFINPYLAVSVKDFWRRWHISLSEWLRDYVYIPLGGSRRGNLRKYINLLITFTVSGIWHGTGLNFLIWGLFHGVCQIIGDVTDEVRSSFRKNSGITGISERIIRSLFTFILVDFAWHFFRADSAITAINMLGRAFSNMDLWVLTDGSLFTLMEGGDLLIAICGIIIIMAVDIMHERNMHLREAIGRLYLPLRWAIYLSALFFVVLYGRYGSGYSLSDFIYQGF